MFSSGTSAAVASAKGNVFSAPALHAYPNSVVDRPTVFPFARGVGLMGEAGPEAIMPLRRTADGSLGVVGSGGSNVQVNVINNANGTQATTSERQENGVNIIDIMIEQVDAGLAARHRNGLSTFGRALERGRQMY